MDEAGKGVESTIRAGRLSDAGPLSSLIRELGLGGVGDETPEVTVARVVFQLEACLRDECHSLLVAEAAAVGPVGYVSVHWLPYLFLAGPEGFVSELFVAEPYRGAGLGSALLGAVVEEAKLRDCLRLSLLAVRTRESYARGFYQKRGWIEREDMSSLIYRL